MADDVRLTAKARKVAASCWFDMARIQVRVTRGKIYMQGVIIRMGEDPEDPDCNLPFLEKLSDNVRCLPGCKGAFYSFSNWKQNKAGGWLFIGKRPKPKKKAAPEINKGPKPVTEPEKGATGTSGPDVAPVLASDEVETEQATVSL